MGYNNYFLDEKYQLSNDQVVYHMQERIDSILEGSGNNKMFPTSPICAKNKSILENVEEDVVGFPMESFSNGRNVDVNKICRVVGTVYFPAEVISVFIQCLLDCLNGQRVSSNASIISQNSIGRQITHENITISETTGGMQSVDLEDTQMGFKLLVDKGQLKNYFSDMQYTSPSGVFSGDEYNNFDSLAVNVDIGKEFNGTFDIEIESIAWGGCTFNHYTGMLSIELTGYSRKDKKHYKYFMRKNILDIFSYPIFRVGFHKQVNRIYVSGAIIVM